MSSVEDTIEGTAGRKPCYVFFSRILTSPGIARTVLEEATEIFSKSSIAKGFSTKKGMHSIMN